MDTGRQPHDLVKWVAEKADEIEEGLKTGDYKRCKKCGRDLPVEMFQDSGAKSGFGRLCRECKSTAAPANNKPRFRRRYRRWGGSAATCFSHWQHKRHSIHCDEC